MTVRRGRIAAGMVLVAACVAMTGCASTEAPGSTGDAAASERAMPDASASHSVASDRAMPTGDAAASAIESDAHSTDPSTGTSTSSPTGETAPVAGRLAAAMATVPADVDTVEFIDHVAVQKRLGFESLHSDVDLDSPSWQKFAAALQHEPGGRLDADIVAMLDGAWGWSGLDVDWEVTSTQGGSATTVYRLRDSVDIDTVIDSFTADGYTRSESGTLSTFHAAIDSASIISALMQVTVLPQRRLLVAGPAPDPVLDVLADDGASLAGAAQLSRLEPGGDDVDYAYVALGDAACHATASANAGATANATAGGSEADDAAALHRVDGWAAIVTDDGGVSVAVDVGSADAAAADAAARAAALRDAVSAQTGQPLPFTVADSAVRGRVMSATLDVEHTATLQQMIMRRDVPWAMCA